MSDSRPLQPGDLVQVVRGVDCCNIATGAEGTIFKVTGFHTASLMRCKFCHSVKVSVLCAEGWTRFISAYRLKRIPPLADLEGLRDAADIPVPKEKIHVR